MLDYEGQKLVLSTPGMSSIYTKTLLLTTQQADYSIVEPQPTVAVPNISIMTSDTYRSRRVKNSLGKCVMSSRNQESASLMKNWERDRKEPLINRLSAGVHRQEPLKERISQVVYKLKSQISGVMPEVSYELGEISESLNGMVMEVGEATGQGFDMEASGAEATKIMGEANTIAEQRMREKFPALPIPTPATLERPIEPSFPK